MDVGEVGSALLVRPLPPPPPPPPPATRGEEEDTVSDMGDPATPAIGDEGSSSGNVTMERLESSPALALTKENRLLKFRKLDSNEDGIGCCAAPVSSNEVERLLWLGSSVAGRSAVVDVELVGVASEWLPPPSLPLTVPPPPPV